MELWKPGQVAIDATSKALLDDVDNVARRVNDARPLPGPVLQRIDEALLGDRVYNSNAIEGNTLDLRETILVLKKGIDAAGPARRREALEARNLGEAVRKVADLVSQEKVLGIETLLEIHSLLLRDIDDLIAGRFRTRRVMIQGARYQPPDQAIVPSLVERTLEILQSETKTHPVVLATWVHWALARIHPFQDGNGRLARLVQDLVLLQGRMTCAVIESTARTAYLHALQDADEGQLNPLIQCVAQRVLGTFDRYIAELRKDEELDAFARQVTGESDTPREPNLQLDYMRWKRRMSQFLTEFELCAAKIADHSKDIRIQIRPHDIIDQTRWENIRSGVAAERTWFFTADFSRGPRRSQYHFCFSRHDWTDQDNPQDRAEQAVSLLVCKDQGDGHRLPLDQLDECPLTIREAFPVNGGFTCRVATTDGNDEYKRDLEPVEIVKLIIEQIVRLDLS